MSTPELHERVRQIAEENRRLFRKIADGEERLRQLARSVWRGQERERRRLARELHDGVGQTLTALKNQLQWLARGVPGSSELEQRLAESVELASSALDETRQLSRMLRPPVLDDLGLEAALRWLVRSLHKSSGMEVDLVLDLSSGGCSEGATVDDDRESRQTDGESALDLDRRVPMAESGLSSELETVVFRVVQEALTNVLKHAGTLEVSVSVRRREKRLELEIRDRGRGFDLVIAGNQSGLGLRGIRDRVEIFGGSARIESVPGEGTLISAILPIGSAKVVRS